MEQFIISPDDCLILKAFKEAHSLREAAQVLNCDPAGLLRKVQRISDEHGHLQKINGRWALTSSGKILVAWVEESMEAQKKLLLGKSSLRISSTSWMIEQFLIPNLLRLKEKISPETNIDLSIPNKRLESHLTEGGCDYVIVCHPPEDPAVAHKQLFKEEWVVIVPGQWKEKGRTLNLSDLEKRPFIRHDQLNPDLFGFNSSKLGSMTMLTVDNLIAVRSAVEAGIGWSVVPVILVAKLIKDKKVLTVDHSIDMDRKLCLWWPRHRSDLKKQANLIGSWLMENHDKMSSLI